MAHHSHDDAVREVVDVARSNCVCSIRGQNTKGARRLHEGPSHMAYRYRLCTACALKCRSLPRTHPNAQSPAVPTHLDVPLVKEQPARRRHLWSLVLPPSHHHAARLLVLAAEHGLAHLQDSAQTVTNGQGDAT